MIAHGFDVASCARACSEGRLHDWVMGYLSQPGWANPGLIEGLRREATAWSEPCLVDLDRLTRVCGPEPGMTYPIPASNWEARIARYAQSFTSIEALPPLIVEARSNRLIVNDGSHRIGMLQRMGIAQAWAIIWRKTPR